MNGLPVICREQSFEQRPQGGGMKRFVRGDHVRVAGTLFNGASGQDGSV